MADLARAYFIRTSDEAGGSDAPVSEGSGVNQGSANVPAQGVAVQFNPLTLQCGLSINNPQPGAQPQSTQHVARAEATLEMDLVFDTTHDGSDVRARTVPVRNLALASESPGNTGAGSNSGGGSGSGSPAAHPAPPKVAFVWGTFRFVGVVSGFRETLDFFSAEGVPVRSGVHVSLRGTQNSEAFTPADRTAALGSGLGESLGSLGRQDANAGRAAAAALGAASVRVGLSAGAGRGGGSGMRVGASVSVSASASLPGASSASAAACQSALGQLAQINAQSHAAVATPLGGQFGFGGAAQGSEPSGLRSRLGVLDFSASQDT